MEKPDFPPMLAKAVKELPEGEFAYEPKWDGFRCVLVRRGGQSWLWSRSARLLNRYFPELVSAVDSLPPDCVLDGEIVVREGEVGQQRLSWEKLSARIHPAASRVAMLAATMPAEIIFFDLLGLAEHALLELAYVERRALLVELFARAELHPSLHLSAMTTDAKLAADWFVRFEGAGLDGVIAKALSDPYAPGKRAMLKLKHQRTAEAVVIGYRLSSGRKDVVRSLMLGMYDGDQLIKVGGIGALTDSARDELVEVLAPLRRYEDGKPVIWETAKSRYRKEESALFAIEPELVLEVAFDQLEGNRFRYAVTFLRWRPDRDPKSCLIDQVERAISYDLGAVLDA